MRWACDPPRIRRTCWTAYRSVIIGFNRKTIGVLAVGAGRLCRRRSAAAAFGSLWFEVVDQVFLSFRRKFRWRRVKRRAGNEDPFASRGLAAGYAHIQVDGKK